MATSSPAVSLSCIDWQVLKAPWVFVFTWFGLFFSFNSKVHFHADYQICDLQLLKQALQPVCSSQLLHPHGLFSVPPLSIQGGAAC